MDTNILDTISREADEETNNVVNKTIIKNQLINSNLIYSYKSKYVVAFTKANSLRFVMYASLLITPSLSIRCQNSPPALLASSLIRSFIIFLLH